MILSTLVSCLMPVYNASKYLKAAIDSILEQSFEDYEFIIINDGSTDNSEEIIKGYKDSRIKYFYQANAGVASALNKGLELAQGKYIWRNDADDISLPTKLERQVKFLEENQDFDLVAVQVAFLTENGKPAWDFRQPKNKYFCNEKFIEVKREHFNPYSPITHGTVLISRKCMIELGGYRKEFITGEDIDLWLRFLQKYKAAVLNQCLSLHRLSSTSATKVHGWKNEFFRNLAFSYYDQRENEGLDDLQKGLLISSPLVNVDKNNAIKVNGKNYRGDLLSFHYRLHLNAKDWRGVVNIIQIALKDGWKLSTTWRSILYGLLGSKILEKGVKLKRAFRLS
jgi:glycosyltransferase involved in cell wall biosynthesis